MMAEDRHAEQVDDDQTVSELDAAEAADFDAAMHEIEAHPVSNAPWDEHIRRRRKGEGAE